MHQFRTYEHHYQSERNRRGRADGHLGLSLVERDPGRPRRCADFKWNATEQTATTARGSFSATCAGDLKVAGTAQGTLNGSVITWSADGDATTAGIACHITLTGTAELGANSIRVPYSGDTCAGKVSGVEILNKK